FGWRNPFAAVWGVLDRDDVLWLGGERYLRETPLHEHTQALRLHKHVSWPRPNCTVVTPEGFQAYSAAQFLGKMGCPKYPSSPSWWRKLHGVTTTVPLPFQPRHIAGGIQHAPPLPRQRHLMSNDLDSPQEVSGSGFPVRPLGLDFLPQLRFQVVDD